MDRVGPGEAAQDRLSARGAGPDRGRVLDHLVVLLGDDVPPDRPRQRRRQPRVRVGFAGGRAVEPDLVDPLDPREQVEAEEPGDAEADLGLYVDKSSDRDGP